MGFISPGDKFFRRIAMLKTILVATDNSANSRKAVETAGDIACKYGAKLILLNVIHPQRVNTEFKRMLEVENLMDPGPNLMKVTSKFPETVAESLTKLNESVDASYRYLQLMAEQILEHANKIVLKQGIKDAKSQIEDGDPAQQILQCADREKADLILVGSRGLSELKGLLMGSVSHKVSQYAKCNCMIVK
jgi:nucleotide-binding universal stress UspA family protein